MNTIKKFIRELKRVRWVSLKEANKSFIKVVIFSTFAALILFGLALGFAQLWNELGVGING